MHCLQHTFRFWATTLSAERWDWRCRRCCLLIGNQGMYQKFFSARSESDAKKVRYWMDYRYGHAGDAARGRRGHRKLKAPYGSPTGNHSADCERRVTFAAWGHFARRSVRESDLDSE